MRASLLRTIPWVAAGAALLAFVAPGCGIGGDDLFGGTSAASGAATSGSGASNTGGDGNGGDSSGPGPGTQSSGPGPGAGGQGGDPSSGPGGAPNGPASSSAEASSSSGPPPVPPVECGGVSCVLGQESCCWDANKWNGAPQGECVTGGVFTDNCNTDYVLFVEAGAETRIECQLPEHCPGQVCCGHRNIYGQGEDAFVYYDITSCQSTCDNDDRILCNPMGPDDCPGGSSCNPSTLLPPGYFVCSFM